MIFDILDTDIYYINLDSQTERNEEFLSVLRNAGFSIDRIHRVSGVLNSYKDSFDSHIKALKIGLTGGKPFIIIEDDMKINKLPPKIDLYATGFPYIDAISLALSRYGVLDDPTPYNSFRTSFNYVIKSSFGHDYLFRIFNMIVGNAVYYHNMDYVNYLINHLETFYRLSEYTSPITGRTYNAFPYMPVDAIMAFVQPTVFFTALKNPAFYHPGELEWVTRFNLAEI